MPLRLRRLFLLFALLVPAAGLLAAGTPAGDVTLSCNLSVAIPAGGNVITAYTVPVQPSQKISYNAGTGANQVNKVAQAGGNAAAAAASIDLSSLACVDGTTGFAHWRELLVFNDDTTNNLTWDFTATNANIAMFGAGGATAKITIPPGSCQRFSIPKGATGATVDGTHKVISLDPGANTIAYRVVAAGD